MFEEEEAEEGGGVGGSRETIEPDTERLRLTGGGCFIFSAKVSLEATSDSDATPTGRERGMPKFSCLSSAASSATGSAEAVGGDVESLPPVDALAAPHS